MKNTIIIPLVPFYFIRHGQTDWNKAHQILCKDDDITLNETGLLQAANISKKLDFLKISRIYSSPLMRAKQTAEIINTRLAVDLQFHDSLGKIADEQVAIALPAILDPSHITLIVSHGEVYRVLLRILNAQADHLNAQNCGLYFFTPPGLLSDQWKSFALTDFFI